MNRTAEIIFHEIVDLSPDQRESYFRERQVPSDVRAEVTALLRFDSEPGDSLAACVAASAEQFLQASGGSEQNRLCGPYLLLRVLGRGGMGSVYLAERADGEVEQRVAIKFLRSGNNGQAFLDRFLRERQILATLSHPGISRLLDAGHTNDGQPYLVMDYIDGTAIDGYAKGLDLRSKLGLFLRVCEAVSYAHRNLIIHRDIKPSNILVDASGSPRLLDFGIAKFLDAQGDQTHTEDRMLTPEYASPEQLRGTAQSAASDIYSLSAVLYKLLTGRSPHALASNNRHALESAICSTEPAAPSSLNPALPRDLDFILRKGLRKEPQERYGSVDALADDIRAFLELRPVRARSGNAPYRIRKFVRRYWAAVAAAALVVISLSAGLYVAERERALAQRRFLEVRQLAHTFIFDLHDQIAGLEGSTKIRETMVRTGLEYLDNLARDSGGDLDLQREIAAAYMKIGDAEGYPTKPNLGRTADAMASYRKAGDIYRRIAGRDSSYLPDLAKYYAAFAGLVRFNSLKEARRLSESAIQAFDRARARQSFDPQMQDSYAMVWCTLGDMDEDLGEYAKAWTEFSRCRDLARAQIKVKRDPQAVSTLSQASERIGTAARELGRFSEALQAFGEDESLLAELVAAAPLNPRLHRREALLHQFRSTVYYDDRYPNLDDPARALQSAKRYLDAATEMVRADPSNTSAQFSRATAMNRVSYSLREFDPNAALGMARDSVRVFQDLMASGKPTSLVSSGLAQALYRLGETQLKAGRVAEAQRSAEAALARQRSIAAEYPEHWAERLMLAQMLILAGETNSNAGNFERAENLLRECREVAQQIAKRQDLTSIIPLADSEQSLGNFYWRRGRTEEARACYQRLVGIWQHFPEANPYVDRRRAAALALSVRSADYPAISLRSHASASRSSRRTTGTGMESASAHSSAIIPAK